MNKLTFSKLRKINIKRCEKIYHEDGGIDAWSPNDWMTAVCGEVGEAANFLKKIKRGDEGVTVQDVGKELADVVIYLDLLATRLRLNLGQEVINKFNETSKKYGFKDQL